MTVVQEAPDTLITEEIIATILKTMMDPVKLNSQISQLRVLEPKLEFLPKSVMNEIIIPQLTKIDSSLFEQIKDVGGNEGPTDKTKKLKYCLGTMYWTGVLLVWEAFSRQWEGVSCMAVDKSKNAQAVFTAFERGEMPAKFYDYDIKSIKNLDPDSISKLKNAQKAFSERKELGENIELLSIIGVNIDSLKA